MAGYVATVVVNLDELGKISKDPHFGKKLADAILSVQAKDRTVRASIGSAAFVAAVHHGDHTLDVRVGHNTAKVIKAIPQELRFD